MYLDVHMKGIIYNLVLTYISISYDDFTYWLNVESQYVYRLVGETILFGVSMFCRHIPITCFSIIKHMRYSRIRSYIMRNDVSFVLS